MAKESFVLVSLQEEKAKKLTKALHNESCRKILDFLTSGEATESELAKKLQLPISTVHYNLRQLSDAGLVIAEEFHYSQKGKEVNHYKLANKYIIITPKSTFGIKEKLKSILPVALLIGASAFAIDFIGKSRHVSFGAEKAMLAAAESAPAASALAASAQPASPAWWFLAGALAAIAIYLAVDFIRKKGQIS